MRKNRQAKRRGLGQYLSELRRSAASGTHRKTGKDRANKERRAVEQDRRDSS